MTELIENSVAVADVAKTLKKTAAAVEADARDLNLFVGVNWAGKPAIGVRDAAALVSGDARREHDHAAAHGRWRADSEAWEADREDCRRTAFADHFDTARRRGVGDPAASSEASQVASAAIEAYEKSTPAPVFADAESPGVFTQMTNRIKEKVR